MWSGSAGRPATTRASIRWALSRSSCRRSTAVERWASATITAYPWRWARCSTARRKGRNTGLARLGTSTPMIIDRSVRRLRAGALGE